MRGGRGAGGLIVAGHAVQAVAGVVGKSRASLQLGTECELAAQCGEQQRPLGAVRLRGGIEGCLDDSP
jgi:hypothetical protein